MFFAHGTQCVRYSLLVQMRVLILGNPDSIWTKEFIEYAIIRPDIKVSVLYNSQASGKFARFYESLGVEVIMAPPVSAFVMKIPKFRAVLMQKNYIRAARRYSPFDVIINMFVSPDTLYCAIAQKIDRERVLAYFCGSDIIRADALTCFRLKSLLIKTDHVVFASTSVQKTFEEKIGYLNDCKQTTIRLGLSVFSNIDWELTNSSIEKCKRSLGIPIGKITVSIGYNGSEAQNHLCVLKQIKLISPEIKKKILILLPMTYASTKQYSAQVEAVAKVTGCEVMIFNEYMDHKTIAQLRLATDIFINAQVSDGLSASVLESMYAGASLLNASWLHYIEYDNWGLKYRNFSKFEDLPELLSNVMRTPLMRNEKNREILSSKMSWHQCKVAWDKLLNGNR